MVDSCGETLFTVVVEVNVCTQPKRGQIEIVVFLDKFALWDLLSVAINVMHFSNVPRMINYGGN